MKVPQGMLVAPHTTLAPPVRMKVPQGTWAAPHIIPALPVKMKAPQGISANSCFLHIGKFEANHHVASQIGISMVTG